MKADLIVALKTAQIR